MIIAIDGPSGTGKSAVAQEVAKRLNFLYLDTGALYRLFAYHLMKKHYLFDNDKEVNQAFEDFDFDIQKTEEGYSYFLENEDVSIAIRQEKVSELASNISKSPLVRDRLLPFQKIFGKNKSLVMEGRDIGTVVFPKAELKIFLTAKEEIRAQRRLKQLQEKFPFNHYDSETILKQQAERDSQDQNRKIAPLKQADDAILIDTSELTLEQVVQSIIELADQKEKK